MDEHGVMGQAGPSDEFQVTVPDTIPTSDPIALVRESFDLDLPISLFFKYDEDSTDLNLNFFAFFFGLSESYFPFEAS
jgi:hypothetical protein